MRTRIESLRTLMSPWWGISLLLLAGCSIILPSSNVSWSENYALVKHGGECSVPQMADGNMNTFGEIGIHAVLSQASNGRWLEIRELKALREPEWQKLKIQGGELQATPQVGIRFLQERTVDRIVIHAEDLGLYEVFSRDVRGKWHRIASGRHRGKKPIQINTHIVTPLLLIEATPNTEGPSGVLASVRPDRLVEIQLQHMEPRSTGKVAEIEVYGKIYRDLAPASEQAE